MKLIDKDAVLAEMERRRDAALRRQHNLEAIGQETVCNEMVANELNIIISLLDTFEVEGEDLDFEIKKDWLFADKTEVDCFESMCLTKDMFVSLAKKYFALGLKMQKRE